MVDRLSKEVRAAEKQVDDYFKTLNFFKNSLAQCVWTYLAAIEEYALKDSRQRLRPGDYIASVDNLVNAAKWPLHWIFNYSSKSNANINMNFNDSRYEESLLLHNLGLDYGQFCTAFTLASRGYITLSRKEDTIYSTDQLTRNTSYEAYDHIVRESDNGFNYSGVSELRKVEKIILDSLEINGFNFRYKFTEQLVDQSVRAMQAITRSSTTLISQWTFGEYSAKQLFDVGIYINAVAMIHNLARKRSADLGCKALGYCNSVLLFSNNDLIKKISLKMKMQKEVVAKIINDLTYRAEEGSVSDPAIHPLIPIHSNAVALSPNIVLRLNYDRNCAVMLNKYSKSRPHYNAQTNSREQEIRDIIVNGLTGMSFRYWNGRINSNTKLPDIDLAIISDFDKSVILVEIKAFIEPAEPKEIMAKDEEIRKGVTQLKILRSQIHEKPNNLHKCLMIDDSYTVGYVLVSENSIGTLSVQDDLVPVLRREHFVRSLKTIGNLMKFMSWIDSRQYLPKLNHDYSEITTYHTINGIKLEWYGLIPLVDKL